jgi:hypothetical protein
MAAPKGTKAVEWLSRRAKAQRGGNAAKPDGFDRAAHITRPILEAYQRALWRSTKANGQGRAGFRRTPAGHGSAGRGFRDTKRWCNWPLTMLHLIFLKITCNEGGDPLKYMYVFQGTVVSGCRHP